MTDLEALKELDTFLAEWAARHGVHAVVAVSCHAADQDGSVIHWKVSGCQVCGVGAAKLALPEVERALDQPANTLVH